MKTCLESININKIFFFILTDDTKSQKTLFVNKLIETVLI